MHSFEWSKKTLRQFVIQDVFDFIVSKVQDTQLFDIQYAYIHVYILAYFFKKYGINILLMLEKSFYFQIKKNQKNKFRY